MGKETTLCIVQLVLLYGTHHARLPQYVFRADSCPSTKNSSHWQNSSKRLHCLHDLNSADTGNVYHCLPSHFLNETVEFCGKAIIVPPGHCPIYNYTNKADDVPGLYNCSAFTSGCPTESFSSKDVRKFPSCLNLNREHRCYEEERNCPKTSVTQVPKEATNDGNTVTISTSTISTKTSWQSIPTDSSPDIPTPDNHDKAIYVLTIFIIIGIALIGQIISLRYLYVYRRRYMYLQMEKAITDERNHIEMKRTVDSSDEDRGEVLTPLLLENYTDQNVPNITTANFDESCQREDMMEEKTVEGFQEFHAFLEKIGGCITDGTLHAMKTILQDLMDQKCVQKMNTTRMLNELLDTFKLQYNMSFLEWIFEKCGDHQLVEKCQKFSAGHIFNLECFQTHLNACGQQHLKFQLIMTELESHTSEVQELRYWLAKSMNVHPGQIIMTALQSGPIVVTFTMKEAYIKTFLKYIETDDGQIAASQRKVEKVINETVINIEKAINGSNFIHVRLSYKTNALPGLKESVRKVGSSIVSKTGVSLEGNEIYVRSVQTESKEKVARENSSFENFMQRNQISLLENLEPKSLITNSNISFDSTTMTKMETIENRRDRAKYFLELCLNLPKEEQEMVITLLREIIVSSKEMPEVAELGPARCWIQENQETLLDEIDTDFIKTTINHMEDVPNEVYTSWMDQSKGRKERAKIFLEFALRKDEYVLALQKTLKEKRIECMRVEIA